METTYTHDTGARRRGGVRTTQNRRRGVALAPKECRRLLQLAVCVALFLTVFFGRGIFPNQVDAVRKELLSAIHADTDFRVAFANLGQSISQKEPVVETLGNLWVDVFSGEKEILRPVSRSPQYLATYYSEREFMTSDPTAEEILARRFGIPAQEVPATVEQPQPTPTVTPLPEEILPPQPIPVYAGPAMPEGATMEDVDLGMNKTASPVLAVVSSSYGWREHPIAGGEKFHSGVDLAADYGSAIGAFADGTVDYIGESPAYGQYLQIRHGNGVTSFYAHCSKLCVEKGENVAAGEKIAEVGNTGNVTGTHLHFELKSNGNFVNPLFYIQTLAK